MRKNIIKPSEVRFLDRAEAEELYGKENISPDYGNEELRAAVETFDMEEQMQRYMMLEFQINRIYRQRTVTNREAYEQNGSFNHEVH